jgi:hypothetical protein
VLDLDLPDLARLDDGVHFREGHDPYMQADSGKFSSIWGDLTFHPTGPALSVDHSLTVGFELSLALSASPNPSRNNAHDQRTKDGLEKERRDLGHGGRRAGGWPQFR